MEESFSIVSIAFKNNLNVSSTLATGDPMLSADGVETVELSVVSPSTSTSTLLNDGPINNDGVSYKTA